MSNMPRIPAILANEQRHTFRCFIWKVIFFFTIGFIRMSHVAHLTHITYLGATQPEILEIGEEEEAVAGDSKKFKKIQKNSKK